MRVSVQHCNDQKSYHNECVFRHNGKVIARCDDNRDDYDETVAELEQQGYIING